MDDSSDAHVFFRVLKQMSSRMILVYYGLLMYVCQYLLMGCQRGWRKSGTPCRQRSDFILFKFTHIRVYFKGGTRYLVELGTLNREKTSAKNSCHVVPMKWWSEGWALAGERWKRCFAQRCAERWPAIPQGESTSWFGGSRCSSSSS